MNCKLCRFAGQAVLTGADVDDSLERGGLEPRRIDDVHAVLVLLQQSRRQAYLTGDHHSVRGGKGFACDAHRPGVDARLAGLAVYQVDDLVRDTVANLVRVPFGHGFACEEIARSEEHTSELQSLMRISYAVFCLKKKNKKNKRK